MDEEKQRIYWIWSDMVSRCSRPTHKAYKDYGGRGITVCDKWKNSFYNFVEDMGNRPVNTHLDRKDNNKGYSKENCRWVTRLQNNNNKRIYKHNQLKISGVEYRSYGAYRARVRFNGKIIADKTTNDFFEACCFVKSIKNEINLKLITDKKAA